MKRFVSIYILSLFFSGITYGATQVPDICIVKKDSIHIDTLVFFVYPLEDYFDEVGSRDLAGFKSCESNSCLRGYQAVWLVENDSLFLYNIQGCNEYMSWCDESSIPNLKDIFGDDCKNDRVFARWTNGKYRAFDGDVIPCVKKQMFYTEKLIKVKDGEVRKIKRYVNVKPRRKAVPISVATPEMITLFLEEKINWKAMPKRGVDEWVGEIYFTVKKNGRASIKLKTNASDRTIYQTETELFRSLKEIRWYRYYQLGKKVELQFSVKAKFDMANQKVILIK